MSQSLMPPERIARLILSVRGNRVIVDADLAELYGVATKVLNQAVKRNRKRFPQDFMFRLSKMEKSEVVTNCDHLARLKFSPVLPYVFTEHGAIMLANVLNSGHAVETSVFVVGRSYD
ncbi:MAG TPA: ORF6N domain-containing protein [Pyrinomonadaceae bacterium]|nr:ORF6N domain-containing protein [Pyrinomonadaceae bacterium]